MTTIPVPASPGAGPGHRVPGSVPGPAAPDRLPPGSVPGSVPGSEALLADLARAHRTIVEAELSDSIVERYLGAHLAAQQVAAVVLAARAVRLGSGPRDPWGALAQAAPECGEWAAYFAATQPKRQAVAAGVRAIITEREADDLVRDAQGFHDLVARRLRRCASSRAPRRTEGHTGQHAGGQVPAAAERSGAERRRGA